MKPVVSKNAVHTGAYDSPDKFTLSNANNPMRRADARNRDNGRRNASVGKDNGHKGGRRRRARSMGRYPFLAMIPKYLQDHSAVLCPETRKVRKERLERIGRRMYQLKEMNIISTTNPLKLTREDALVIVNDMSSRGWKPTYLGEMLKTLRLFVSYCGNPVFDELARLKLLPKAPNPPVKTLTDEELNAIFQGAERISRWEGEVARFLCAIYPATGLRASELRLARIQDIDIKKWEIRVVNPKGKERYASERIVPIHPMARETIIHFLEARYQRFAKYGIEEAEPLIPRIIDGKAGYYSVPGLRNIKLAVEQASGIKFKFKDFRSTFAQRTIDLDPSLLSSVSKALGHSTTMTTEHYYARIRDAPAIKLIQDAWGKLKCQDQKTQSGLIDRKTPLAGYA